MRPRHFYADLSKSREANLDWPDLQKIKNPSGQGALEEINADLSKSTEVNLDQPDLQEMKKP